MTRRRITREDVATATLMRATGATWTAIAAAIGCSPGGIHYRLTRATGRPGRVARCGEPGGYKRHRRLGEVACDPCLQAWNDKCAAVRGGERLVDATPAREAITAARAAGMSIAEMSRRTGVPTSTLQHLATDRPTTRPDNLAAVLTLTQED